MPTVPSSFGRIGLVGLVKYGTISNHSAAVDGRYSADGGRGKRQVKDSRLGITPRPFLFGKSKNG